jgi:DNA-binding CsgD family transcriptional regulator
MERDLRRMRPLLDTESTGPTQPFLIAIAAVLVTMTLLVSVDVALDVRAAELPWQGHVGLDLLIAALGLGGTAALAARLVGVHRRAQVLKDRLRAAEGEAQRFRDESRAYLRGLAVAIDRQLLRWALSPAEREVVLLLLKGLSLKEVASIRGCSERTARHQARAAYRKAGLAGRIELAAFFLEDLLVPGSAAEATELAAPELKATYDAPPPAGS